MWIKLVRFDRIAILALLLALLPTVAVQAQAQPDPPLVDSFRVWKDADEKVLSKSRFAFLDGENVALWQESGQMMLIPRAQLSAADRAWLTQHPLKILRGKVIFVADGDTIGVLDEDKKQHRIRLEGIDAPESGQAFGTQSRKALNEVIYGKQVLVAYEEEDQYGRILGHVYWDGRWLNHDQLVLGMAWHYRHFNGEQYLANLHEKAETEKVGLWRDPNRQAPWRFRLDEKRRREAEEAKRPMSSVEPTGFWLNLSSGVRHNAECKHYGKTSRGKYCTADEGKPCGMCGG